MPEDDLTRIKTVLFGFSGNNGLNRDTRDNADAIRKVDGRVDQLSHEIERRLGAIYKMLATLTVTILVGLIGVIATLVLLQ